jgi:hypothetical protein
MSMQAKLKSGHVGRNSFIVASLWGGNKIRLRLIVVILFDRMFRSGLLESSVGSQYSTVFVSSRQ